MKIIKVNAIELKQQDGFEGMLKHIELCGRTCYKSEDKITDGSAEKFVNMLRSHAHGAMLEHGTIYLKIGPTYTLLESDLADFFANNPYSKVITHTFDDTTEWLITTNYRVINEMPDVYKNIWEKYMCEPTEYHAKRRTFKITCNRGVSHEFVRHRVFSFAQESQRYCNYSKDKFGKEIKVIKPLYFEEGSEKYVHWSIGCQHAECRYFDLLDKGATPQEARDVLPNASATELIMTGFESDWEHFFNLRCAKDAHPQAQEVANIIKEQF